MGFSMGGQATIMSASDQEAVDKYKIGAAVAIHPAAFYRRTVQVPILFVTGDYEDEVTSYVDARYMYEHTEGVPKAYASAQDASHAYPRTEENAWTIHAIHFFNCHLLGNLYDCNSIYVKEENDDPCSLCSCPELVEISECYTDF